MSVHSRWPLTTGVAQGRYYCIYCYHHDDVHSCKGSDNLDTKPSLQEERLRSRGTENEDSIKKRLAAANAELEYGQ